MRKEKLEELNKYIEELKTIKMDLVHDRNPHFITSKQYDVYLNNGMCIPREKLFKNNLDGSAVSIVPVLENNEFLVVIEPRVFTKLGVAMSFPSGYIEKNEDPKDAALRELKEETGYSSNDIVHLDSYYQDEGISSAYNHLFLALNSYKKYEQNLDENEVVRYMSLTFDELLEVENMGILCGASAKLALCRIKERGFKNE